MPNDVRKILILGGTKDARMIADRLVDSGHDVTTSFAGVTTQPNLPKGTIRRGGFGGTQGLRHYLLAGKFDVLINATHPYAAQISANVAAATRDLPLTHLRFEREPWQPKSEDHWIVVANVASAAESLPPGARVLLTIGRKEIAPFLMRPDVSGVIRTIEPPIDELPIHWRLIQERPPFSLESEIALMRAEAISHLVTKNAGGTETSAKLEAARIEGLDVIIIDRPIKSGGIVVRSTDEICQMVRDMQLFHR
jgi:precorrin-6A/cobalt-precorrin-6A reductase